MNRLPTHHLEGHCHPHTSQRTLLPRSAAPLCSTSRRSATTVLAHLSSPSSQPPQPQQPQRLWLPTAPLPLRSAAPSASSPTSSSSSSSSPDPASSRRSDSAAASSSGRGASTVPRASATAAAAPVAIDSEPPMLFLGDQRIHSLSNRGMDVIQSLQGWAQRDLDKYLRPVERCWQPTDFLPDSSSPDFLDAVHTMREASQTLPLDYLVVLVGDMVTEEALPSYMNMLNLLDGTKDETGAQTHPWASWTRAWTAEENRHGDLLNKYLYLTGRVDMRQVEVTIQNLIGKGMDAKLENNPYLCFVYTSFQERATKISHANTAKLAHHNGDDLLGKICTAIANDEARHEVAYAQIVQELMARDPDGTMLAFADMMKKGITMPAHFVDDNWHAASNSGQTLFVDYATVADALGVYTTQDYAAIVDHLVKRWDIPNVRVTSGAAAEAQAFLVHHADRVRRLADIQTERRLRDRKRGRSRTAAFSWIGKREVSLV